MEGAASLPHRSEAGELTLARRRCSSGSPLYAAATCRSLPDDCQGRRSLRGGGCCQELARAHPTPSTGLWGVGCSGARSRCSCPSPPNPASAMPRGRSLLARNPLRGPPLKGGTTRWRRPPPASRFIHGCDAMLCNAVLGYAELCHAKPCCALLRHAMMCSWESASLHDWSSDARVARGGRASRLGRCATSATVERSA